MCPPDLTEPPDAPGFHKSSPEKAVLSGKENPCVAGVTATKHLLPTHPLWLVACLRAVISCQGSFHREFVQADILDRGPNDGETTGLGGEHIDLIGALPHIAEKTLNGIGGLNVSVHALRKGIKR
jgi:hypothetical protein